MTTFGIAAGSRPIVESNAAIVSLSSIRRSNMSPHGPSTPIGSVRISGGIPVSKRTGPCG